MQELLEVLNGFENIQTLEIQPLSLLVTLKNPDVDLDKVKKVNGITDAALQQNTLQIVCKHPQEMYDAIQKSIENHKTFNLKSIGNKILNVLSGSLVPLIPMLIAAAMFKTVASICGPDMLGWISDSSDLYKLFTFVGDAGFYFFPIVVGYTSAKTFHTNPVLGMFLGAIFLHPTLMEMVNQGKMISVYGIPMAAVNYSGTILPTILSVGVLSLVERFFQRIIPDALKVVFVPFLSIAIMLPLALCILGPAGSIAGNLLCNFLLAMGQKGGIFKILTIMILGALWQFIIMGGLHWLFISTIFMVLAQSGQESIITAICGASAFSVGGMCLGILLRLKDKEKRSLVISCLIAQVIGGVTEPGIYGVGIAYKKPLAGMVLGGMLGGMFSGIVGLTAYNFMPVASFLCIFNYAGGSTWNFVCGIISCVLGFFISGAVTFFVSKDVK